MVKENPSNFGRYAVPYVSIIRLSETSKLKFPMLYASRRKLDALMLFSVGQQRSPTPENPRGRSNREEIVRELFLLASISLAVADCEELQRTLVTQETTRGAGSPNYGSISRSPLGSFGRYRRKTSMTNLSVRNMAL